MENRNLSTFITITEAGSFTKAAELLGYTQSTVSFQVRQLEEELNCRLFDRVNHSVSLTDKGLKLLNYAHRILKEEVSFKEDFMAAETPSGNVRMYSSDSILERMMMYSYHAFSKKYPDIHLFFTPAGTDEMLESLEHNEADVIFTLDQHIYRNNFIVAKEAPVSVRFVVSADHPLALVKHPTIHDILQYPMLLTEQGMSYCRIMEEKLAEMSLTVTPVLETGRTDLLARVLEGSIAVSFLPEFVVKDAIEAGKLKALDVENFEVTIWKQLIYHKNKWISSALKAFIDYVTEHEFQW